MKVKCEIVSVDRDMMQLAGPGVLITLPASEAFAKEFRSCAFDQVFEVDINLFHDMTTEVSQPEA